MTKRVADDFLQAGTEKRLEMIREPAHAAELKDLVGTAAYDEYQELAKKLDTQHLAFRVPKNLIFVPGVMGTLLQSRTRGGIWWVDVRTRQHIDKLGLSPDGSEDLDPSNDIVPATSDPSYDPFLAAALAQDDFAHEIFAYDWRKSFERSADALRDLVLKLSDANARNPIHLVAHSMGGLMVRATLLKHGDELWPRLGKVVFIGTPHYGAPAIAGYLKNHLWGFEWMALLGLYLGRETFRSLWGVLSLLPAPTGVYPGTRQGDPKPWPSNVPDDRYVHPCANFDLYRADQWELDLDPAQTAQLQTILNAAAEFHRKVYEAHQKLSADRRDRMLVIAGVGYKSLFRLAYESRAWGLWQHTAKITSRIEGDAHRDGDGRVPLASAMLENVAIRYVKGVHGELPNIPAVYGDVFQFLRDKPLDLPDTTYGALSQHLAVGDQRSEAPHLDGTATAQRLGDDPGLWNLDPPPAARLAELRAELEKERLPEFTRIRLL